MKKVFIHNYFFRIVAAIMGGVLSYLLILLLNNNLDQLQDYHFGSELYLCIGLAMVLLEVLRLAFVKSDSWFQKSFSRTSIAVKVTLIIVLTILMVSGTIKIYFQKVIGFSPTMGELVEFNAIFLVLAFMYLILFLSSHYLYTVGNEKLISETLRKEELEEDFRQFRQGINPTLLFESLEALLVAIDKDTEEADELIDRLAIIYRYLLSAKNRQLVSYEEEAEKVHELVQLINHLPYRKVKLNVANNIASQVIPGSLMMIVQQIVRTTIMSNNDPLEISIHEKDDAMVVSHERLDKLSKRNLPDGLREIKRSFKVLSDKEISEVLTDRIRSIIVPKLIINQPTL